MLDLPIIASVDVGTNSTRLLVAKCDGRRTYPLVRQMRITRLGRGVDATGLLSHEAIEQTVSVIAEYKDLAWRYTPLALRVAATAALRDCRNAPAFIDAVLLRCGLCTEILSGEEEARLSFLGAISDTERKSCEKKRFMVFDIGGGSTEIIVEDFDWRGCDSNGGTRRAEDVKQLEIHEIKGGAQGDRKMAIRMLSVDVGCVRMSERFLNNDPPSPIQLARMETFIASRLKPAIDSLCASKCDAAIGLAGTVTTVSAIVQGLKSYDSEVIHGSSLRLDDVEKVYLDLSRIPLSERKKLPGLDPGRADVIVGGIAVLRIMMRLSGLETITVSEKDILDGLVIDLYRKHFS